MVPLQVLIFTPQSLPLAQGLCIPDSIMGSSVETATVKIPGEVAHMLSLGSHIQGLSKMVKEEPDK